MSLLVIYKYIIIYTHTFFSNFLMKVVLFYYIDNIFIKNTNGERKEYTRKDCHPPPKKKEKKKDCHVEGFFFLIKSRVNQTRFSIMR